MAENEEFSVNGSPISSLRVVDLKQELEKKGLSKSGTKKELLDRLKSNLKFERDSIKNLEEDKIDQFEKTAEDVKNSESKKDQREDLLTPPPENVTMSQSLNLHNIKIPEENIGNIIHEKLSKSGENWQSLENSNDTLANEDKKKTENQLKISKDEISNDKICIKFQKKLNRGLIVSNYSKLSTDIDKTVTKDDFASLKPMEESKNEENIVMVATAGSKVEQPHGKVEKSSSINENSERAVENIDKNSKGCDILTTEVEKPLSEFIAENSNTTDFVMNNIEESVDLISDSKNDDDYIHDLIKEDDDVNSFNNDNFVIRQSKRDSDIKNISSEKYEKNILSKSNHGEKAVRKRISPPRDESSSKRHKIRESRRSDSHDHFESKSIDEFSSHKSTSYESDLHGNRENKDKYLSDASVSFRKLGSSRNSKTDELDDQPKKKRGWGSSRSSKTEEHNVSVSISSDSLKAVVTEISEKNSFLIQEGPVLPEEIEKGEIVVESEDDAEKLRPPVIKRTKKKHDDDDFLPKELKRSCVLSIKNLVRPFTLNQLKELLKRTGDIVEDGFWIDKIKSWCLVQYTNIDQAVETHHALNGVQWPTSNPKRLRVEFSNEDFLKQKIEKGENPFQKNESISTGRNYSRHNREEGVGGVFASVREWDKNKLDQDKPLEKKHSRSPKLRRSRSATPENRSPLTGVQRPKVKLLVDLFRKTKATPCIYWLPLSAAEIAQKEEERRIRILEREKRLEAMRKEKEAEEKQRQQRIKERQKELERERRRERERDDRRRSNYGRSRSRRSSSSSSSSSSRSRSSSRSEHRSKKRN